MVIDKAELYGKVVRMEVVSVTNDNRVRLICPACNRHWEADADLVSTKANGVRFTARCDCGHSWNCRIEKRKNFRRAVSLPGSYKYVHQNGVPHTGKLEVLDISIKGMKIQLDRDCQLKVGERVEVVYQMDNAAQKTRQQQIEIRNVNGTVIGAMFEK